MRVPRRVTMMDTVIMDIITTTIMNIEAEAIRVTEKMMTTRMIIRSWEFNPL